MTHSAEFDRLISIMKRLRAPGGCPWDRKQTWESLCPHIVEEAYELVDTIERLDDEGMEHLVEECGDVLLQVVFIATIAEERGDFELDDVCRAIADKLVRRHPHIFGDAQVLGADEVLRNWEQIKEQERKNDQSRHDQSLLSGVPRGLPATVKAFRIQQKAATVGFDWQAGDDSPVLDKILEEFAEVREALAKGDAEELTEEIGDLLFAVINLSRRHDIDPDVALSRTNVKFANRFRAVEQNVHQQGGDWSRFSLEELDRFWNKAKEQENHSTNQQD